MDHVETGSVIRRAAVDAWLFVKYLVDRFNANAGFNRAASLTYTSLFAIVPLMTVTFGILSAFAAFEGIGDQLENFIFDNFLPATGATIQERLRDFSSQARELTGLGVGFLVVTAFMMLVNIENAFNHIWQVTQPRRGVSRFLLYGAVLTWGPPITAAGVGVSSYLMSVAQITQLDVLGVRDTVIGAVPSFFEMVGFTALYYLVPNTRVPFLHALVGGATAMLAFEIAKAGFAYFVTVASVQVVYGTFAVVPLFLTWLYLVWSIVLMCAELVRALSIREDRVDRTGAEFTTLVALLHELVSAFRAGTVLPDGRPQRIMRGAAVPWSSLAPRLLDEGLVRQTSDLGWVLGCAPERITLARVASLLPDAVVRAPRLPESEPVEPWVRRLNRRLEHVHQDLLSHLDITLDVLFSDAELPEDVGAEDPGAGDPGTEAAPEPDAALDDGLASATRRPGPDPGAGSGDGHADAGAASLLPATDRANAEAPPRSRAEANTTQRPEDREPDPDDGSGPPPDGAPLRDRVRRLK